jgi:hypothetical protein
MAGYLKTLVLPVSLMLFLSGCMTVSTYRTGNANLSEEYRQLEPFDRVVVTGTFEIEIVRDSVFAALVSIDENLISNVITSVEDGILHVSARERFNNYHQARVIIGSPYISHIRLLGNHKLRAIEVDSDLLEITTDGTVHMELAGLVDQLGLYLDGRNVVNAGALEALYVDLTSSGVSTSTVNAVRTVKAAGTGSTRVWYAGSPESVESAIDGRGFLQKVEDRER